MTKDLQISSFNEIYDKVRQSAFQNPTIPLQGIQWLLYCCCKENVAILVFCLLIVVTYVAVCLHLAIGFLLFNT